jgi:phosphatidylcholine synthase
VERASSGRARGIAWAVHLYTALGLVLAAGATVLVLRGTDAAFRAAFGLLLLATLVDATDGWLARRARVAEVLPGFDGRRLDDIVDFHTYTSIPLLLIWRAGLLPAGWGWILVLPLLASGFGFSRREAKTADGFFLGFPSYWNVVAFYLYFLRPSPVLSAAVLVALAGLTLLPWRYLNLAAPGRRYGPLLALAALWALLIIAVLAGTAGRAWVLVSLVFPAAYMWVSWAVGGGRATGGRASHSGARSGQPGRRDR